MPGYFQVAASRGLSDFGEETQASACGMAEGLRSHLWQNKGQGLFLVLHLETQLCCPLEKARDERKGLELSDLLINQRHLMGFDLRQVLSWIK